MVETELVAVSIVSLVSFWCFDGSGGFVALFRWFRSGGLLSFEAGPPRIFGSPKILLCLQKYNRTPLLRFNNCCSYSIP